MADDEEYRKLSSDDKCVHKLWKARLLGYEEAATLFRQIDDEKSPEFAKFAPIIKKMVSDSHVACQEKGLEAALAFVENYALAGRTVHDVMVSIVQKAILSNKVKIRELSYQVILMYIEIEKHEIVLEELFKGLEQKSPKIVLGCVTVLTMALKDFGAKVINVKAIIKKIPVLLSDRDKAVRDEGKNLTVEIFRWTGAALKTQLTNLQPLQLTELETEFSKVNHNVRPNRYLRSEMAKQTAVNLATAATGVSADGSECNFSENGNQDQPVVEIDPYELAESVDILSKLPKDFYTNVESKKWQDRKTALESLENLLKTPKLDNGDYGDLVRVLKRIIGKDSNVLVIALAAKCLSSVANGLKKRFHPYASSCIPVLFEKFKEKKQNVVQNLREALDGIFISTTLEAILEDATEALNSKNPSVKCETASFLTRCFAKSVPVTLNKKLLKSYVTPLVKNLNESDPTVRDSSAEALGTAMKLVTEKIIVPYLTDVDNLKMTKIKEYAENAVLTAKIPKSAPSMKAPAQPGPSIAKPVVRKPATSSSTIEKPPETVKKSVSKDTILAENDDQESETQSETGNAVTKVDLRNLIGDNLIDEMADKNWKTRNEALIKIQSILTQNKKVKANIGTLAESLALRLVDSNSKIAQCAFNCCELLGEALTSSSKLYLRSLFPAFLQGMGDSKQWIRTVARSCVDIWSEQCQYKEIFEGEMIFDAIKNGSPVLRSELWAWMAEKLPIIPTKNVSKDEMVLWLPIFYNNLEDRNADVRKNAQEAIYPLMLHLGFEKMAKSADKLKPGSKSVIMPLLEKSRANLPPPKSATKPPRVETQNSSSSLKPPSAGNVKGAKVIKKIPTGSANSLSSKKKEEVVENLELFVNNNLKASRINDELKSRVIRWNPLVTRDDMCELLKNQMLQANVNKNLFNNFFHADFKYHLKALESLIDNKNQNVDALLANLDLILKWLSFRFNDTNPSVILKGLDYLYMLLDVLISRDYRISESEAGYIVPYLLIKIGDPKDAVRNGVRLILRKIITIYPCSRMFLQILEALKSKNSRQRAECLEEMEYLITFAGITVCQPNASTAFKEIAKQISDRDNSVRNAALNCIASAYFLEGEKILKFVSNIAEKEMSLLEERLKRYTGKKDKTKLNNTFSVNNLKAAQPETPIKNNQVEVEAEVIVPHQNSCVEDNNADDDLVDEMLQLTLNDRNKSVHCLDKSDLKVPEMTHIEPINGPFSLDWEYIKQLESEKLQCIKPVTKVIDIDFLNEPILYNKEAKIALAKYADKMPPISDFIANTQYKRHHNDENSSNNELEDLLGKIRGPDLVSAIEAMTKLQRTMATIGMNTQNNLENKIIGSLSFMLKWLINSNLEFTHAVQEAYELVLSNLSLFYESRGRLLSTESIFDLIFQLINLLAENKFEGYDQLNRNANLQCANLIEKSNHTNAICALIRLLHKYVGVYSSDSRLVDLTLKCLWRVIKKLPSWEKELDYEPILYESSIFFKDYPSHTWKKDNNIPIRTIKTIIYTIVKMKSVSVIMYFISVPNFRETELYSYTLKVLDALKAEDERNVLLPKDIQRNNSDNFQKSEFNRM